VLERILEVKRREVAERKHAVSMEALLARCAPSTRRLSSALIRARPGFLLEIKFASPSAGAIRDAAELDTVLASYRRHADAISVLTDRTFFGGSFELLARVRDQVDQPVLCKDFILEPYQVAEARRHGADAILLILAAIDDPAWNACCDLAERLGMDVLTEVHDEPEARRAIRLGARIIGVNNRNLATLEVDLGTTPRLAPLIPSDRIVIAESGIETRDQVSGFRQSADAFLVGTSLMREPDLDRAVRQLVYGRTKVCGLTRAEHARAAQQIGATHGGLVFAATSPRRVTRDRAAAIKGDVALEWVGVFADQEPGEIAAIAHELDLAAVQLHGNESTETVSRVRAEVPSRCEVWRALPVTDAIPPASGRDADRLLLDGGNLDPEPGARRGGWGRSFDWRLLEQYPGKEEVVLAGGLGAENAARAAALRTWALDVSSGVEAAPGEKDPVRLARFFAERRRLPGRGSS
jgi:indole-3-glycerol phosphate synthase/phosphoribosylanthranilate isomerase